ncbi:MAG: late promoter transcription accessory protein [Candidatus Poseidoniales archaeon]
MKQKNDIDFMTKTKFSKLVESIVIEKRISYMDAVLHLCEKYVIDPLDSKKYISNIIRNKIEVEAQELNYLPKSSDSTLI